MRTGAVGDKVVWAPLCDKSTLLCPSTSLSVALSDSICGGHDPCEATGAARIFYILSAGPVRPEAVVLRAVGEEQRRVVGRQHRGAIVPPRISQISTQIENIVPSVNHFDILNFMLFRTRLWLHDGLEYFLKTVKIIIF